MHVLIVPITSQVLDRMASLFLLLSYVHVNGRRKTDGVFLLLKLKVWYHYLAPFSLNTFVDSIALFEILWFYLFNVRCLIASFFPRLLS